MNLVLFEDWVGTHSILRKRSQKAEGIKLFVKIIRKGMIRIRSPCHLVGKTDLAVASPPGFWKHGPGWNPGFGVASYVPRVTR